MEPAEQNLADIPSALHEIIVELALDYFRQCPGPTTPALVEFGLQFFQRMKEQLHEQLVDKLANSSVASDTDEGVGSLHASDTGQIVMYPRPRPSTPPVPAAVYMVGSDPNDKLVIYEHSDEEREALAYAAEHALILRALAPNPSNLDFVLRMMYRWHVNAGEYITVQGEDGDCFYIIERGNFVVLDTFTDGGEESEPPRLLRKYEGAGSFGELALLYSAPRAATVRAETNGVLWVMDRHTFRKMVARIAFEKRRDMGHVIDSCGSLLGLLAEYERMLLADSLVPRSFEDGDTILRQGEPADGLYFVETGTVRIVRSQGGRESELANVCRGGYFGELALLTGRPRAASAYAVGTVKCAFLEAGDFERLPQSCIQEMSKRKSDYRKKVRQLFGQKKKKGVKKSVKYWYGRSRESGAPVRNEITPPLRDMPTPSGAGAEGEVDQSPKYLESRDRCKSSGGAWPVGDTLTKTAPRKPKTRYSTKPTLDPNIEAN